MWRGVAPSLSLYQKQSLLCSCISCTSKCILEQSKLCCPSLAFLKRTYSVKDQRLYCESSVLDLAAFTMPVISAIRKKFHCYPDCPKTMQFSTTQVSYPHLANHGPCLVLRLCWSWYSTLCPEQAKTYCTPRSLLSQAPPFEMISCGNKLDKQGAKKGSAQQFGPAKQYLRNCWWAQAPLCA